MSRACLSAGKTLSVITAALVSALALVVMACGGDSQPLPDIDATVEDRVALAKASLVVPTAAPLPTYTPAPAQAPEVVVKEVPVEVAVEKEVIVEAVVTVTPVPIQISSPTPTPTLTPTPTSSFYSKYLDANGIPILASVKVPDEALEVARQIVNQMLVLRPDVRSAMISKRAQVAIMAESEVTTDIPEHAFLKRDRNTDWDQRARGLGGTLRVPTTSSAEENIRCYSNDRYFGENILIHEFAHTIMNIGLPFVEGGPELLNRLDEAYGDALAAGRWVETYAATNVREYWAEGVQSWFNANQYSNPPNGIHNHVSNRDALMEYDPGLADIISQVFSDDWTYSCPSSPS